MRNQISKEEDGQKGLSVCPSKRVAYWVISQLPLCCPVYSFFVPYFPRKET
jgi:hypothetical protein